MYLAVGKADPLQCFTGEGKGGMHKGIRQRPRPSHRFGIKVNPVR